MSHIVDIRVLLTDLDAIKATCKELGLTFVQGQQTYEWWGRSVGDSPIPQGMTREQLGHCTHAIKVPGTTWEIGLVQTGNGYRLAFDTYGYRGEPIVQAIGDKGQKFLQLYGVHKTLIEARRMGHNAVRVPGRNGAVNVVITGGRM